MSSDQHRRENRPGAGTGASAAVTVDAASRNPVEAVSRLVTRLLEWAAQNPAAAHLWRANDRFNNRLGNQFAGGITYFSVLASVPVLMFAFSGLGLLLTVLRPSLMGEVRNIVTTNLYPGPIQDAVLQYLEQYLYHWQTVGVIAIVVALWAGAGWMGNVKSAIRAMWRPEFDMSEDKHFFFVEVALNALLLLGLIVVVGVLLVANTLFTGWGTELLSVAHLDGLGLSQPLIRVISVGATLVGSWMLFVVLFRTLPQTHSSWRSVLRGSAVAAVIFWGLQTGATQLAGLFARNKSAALWGATLIVGLLFLNIFARLILYVAAWIATANQPSVARRWSDFDQLLRERDDTIAVPGHWAAADRDHAEKLAEQRGEYIDQARASRRAAARAVDVVVGSVMSGLGGPPTDVAGAGPLLVPRGGWLPPGQREAVGARTAAPAAEAGGLLPSGFGASESRGDAGAEQISTTSEILTEPTGPRMLAVSTPVVTTAHRTTARRSWGQTFSWLTGLLTGAGLGAALVRRHIGHRRTSHRRSGKRPQ